jgi:hypothetical protein
MCSNDEWSRQCAPWTARGARKKYKWVGGSTDGNKKRIKKENLQQGLLGENDILIAVWRSWGKGPVDKLFWPKRNWMHKSLRLQKANIQVIPSRFPTVPDSFSGFTRPPPQPSVGADDMSCLPAVGLIVFEVSAPYQRTTALSATSPSFRNLSMFPSYPDAENNLFRGMVSQHPQITNTVWVESSVIRA